MTTEDRAARLAEIVERHAKATQEPWEMITCDDGMVMIATAGDVLCVPEPNHPVNDPTDAKNFAFIANAHQDIPWLIAELQATDTRAKEMAARCCGRRLRIPRLTSPTARRRFAAGIVT